MLKCSQIFNFIVLLLLPFPVVAYVGPGGGITAIGALIALVAAVLFTFVGFVWYPLKRLIKKISGNSGSLDDASDEPQDGAELDSSGTEKSD
jgi:hypothetical protein